MCQEPFHLQANQDSWSPKSLMLAGLRPKPTSLWWQGLGSSVHTSLRSRGWPLSSLWWQPISAVLPANQARQGRTLAGNTFFYKRFAGALHLKAALFSSMTLEEGEVGQQEGGSSKLPWMDTVSGTQDHTLNRNIQREKCFRLNNQRMYRQNSFYCTSLYAALHIPHCSQIEGLWQPCIEQVCQHHFSNSICSPCISVSRSDNSHNILNPPRQEKDYNSLKVHMMLLLLLFSRLVMSASLPPHGL